MESESEKIESDKSESDIALMLRAKDGDLAAFGELVRAHQKSVMNFLTRNGVYTDVEDLAQDIFIKIWNSRTRYVPSAKFTTFLYTVARRTMFDWIRSGTRRSALRENYGREIENAANPKPEYCLSDDVEKALSCLSPEQRETVVLVLMQGLQYNEAAEILRVPVGTVKSRVSIATEKMKKAMAEN